MIAIASKPDWHGAAQAVIDHFSELPEHNDRIELLEQLCDRLGGDLYPALLHILYTIEKHAADQVKKDFVETLTYGLSTGRLPNGKISAFGSRSHSSTSYPQYRSLGPLEFLCAWYAQSSPLTDLSSQHFNTICCSLIRLFSINEQAADLYKTLLYTHVSSPVAGLLSSRARSGIHALADAWHENASPEGISSACTTACGAPRPTIEQLTTQSPFGKSF